MRFAPSALPAILMLGGSLACARGTRTPVETISVAAAASLRDLLEAAAPLFEAEHPGLELSLSFAASSTHARQVDAGAEFDVLLSADADSLARAGDRIVAGSEREFLQNRLALVAREGLDTSVRGPADLVACDGPIAVAAPAVPAGRYARAWLAAHDLLEVLEPRFVDGHNVRATLALVEAGAADFGFVYASDHAVSKRARLLWSSAADDESEIVYLGALVSRGGRSQEEERAAQAFLDWLSGEPFQSAAEEAGFLRREP